MHIPPPGANPVTSGGFFDLYRDPRESRPMESIKYGPWAGGQFAGMVKRHKALKQKYPDRPAVHDIPYKGIENLRPETKAIVESFLVGRPKK
jgi:arylsulfatase